MLSPLGCAGPPVGLLYHCWTSIIADKGQLQLIDCRDLGMHSCYFFPTVLYYGTDTYRKIYRNSKYSIDGVPRGIRKFIITALRHIQQMSDVLYLG